MEVNLKINQKPLISIVVPVYNSEKYLNKCLESILNQTYTHFECIVIDDGSTDGSAQIIKSFAQTDPRILLVEKENSGVSSTRNLGIELSKGEFICFVDSDDRIAEDYLMVFTTQASNSEELIIQDILKYGKRKANYSEGSFSLWADVQPILLENNLLYNGGPVSKFYNAGVIKTNQIRFNENISYGEDLVFFLDYIKHIKCLKYVDYAGYHYTIHRESASARKHSFESFYLLHKRVLELIDSLDDLSKYELKYLYKIDWDYIENSINQGIVSKTDDKRQKREFLKQLNKSLNFKHFKYSNSNFRKLIYILLKLNFYSLLLFVIKRTAKT